MIVNRKSITNKSKQNGAIMLALMLILLTGSSYLLLTNLNANSIKISSDIKTSKALNSAKQVLLSYAVSYPDLGNDGGPGYVPCPDITNDGIAAGNCSYSGGTTIGYFPFKTLDTQELRDGNGNRLWYVISERYRYGANKIVPMNSDIADDSINNLDLNIDNISNEIEDIVAIIIAPGIPISSQTRTANLSDSENLNPDNFLEGENADEDQIYTTVRSDSLNDRLIFITRDELMTAVEKRVMGDIAIALQRYRTTYNGLPWLSPFADPAVSPFHSEAGANGYKGHLPFHWSGDAPGSSNRNPFSSDINIAWKEIQNAQISDNADTSGSIELPMPTIECLTNTECTNSEDSFNGQVPVTNVVSDASCIWSSREVFDCAGDFSVSDNNKPIYTSPISIYGYKYNVGRGWVNFYTNTSGSYQWETAYIDQYGIGWANWIVTPVMLGDITRLYEFDIAYIDSNFEPATDIIKPNATSSRTRNLDINDSILVANDVNITVTDRMSNITFYPDFDNEPTIKESGRSLISNGNSTGSIAATGIKYDLDVDAGEIPEWFIENKWHELIYIAYADGEPYPGNTSLSDPCAESTINCLNVDYITPYDTANLSGIRALTVMAGRELPGQDRTVPVLSQYYESNNADSNMQNFVMNTADDNVNDLLKVVLEN